MKKPMRLEGTIPVVFFKEGKEVVAYSPALDLSSCGKTMEKAQLRFREAMRLFFEEIIARDTVEDVLLELGWHNVRGHWVPPQYIGRKNEKVSFALA